MAPSPIIVAAFAGALAVPGVGTGPPGTEAGRSRSELERMEAALDIAVRRVSEPSAAPFFGAVEASRSYRLAGYGVVFVVPPRALPRQGRSVFFLRRRGPAVDAARPRPPRPVAVSGPAEAPVEGPAPPENTAGETTRESRERELRAIELKVEALQHEAERTRQEAEQAFEETFEGVRILLAPNPDPGSAETSTPSAATPEAPVPPAAPPPAPPWRFWFESRAEAVERAPEHVIRDVRTAVTDSLESQGAHLATVRPEEFLTVAVDFVPRWGFDEGAPAIRTLIVRVRKRDLVDRASGKIGVDELRKRFEYVEY